MKYAVEMGSGALLCEYIQSFTKIGSAIQKVRRYTQAHIRHKDRE
jgi:hypothetical protein